MNNFIHEFVRNSPIAKEPSGIVAGDKDEEPAGVPDIVREAVNLVNEDVLTRPGGEKKWRRHCLYSTCVQQYLWELEQNGPKLYYTTFGRDMSHNLYFVLLNSKTWQRFAAICNNFNMYVNTFGRFLRWGVVPFIFQIVGEDVLWTGSKLEWWRIYSSYYIICTDNLINLEIQKCYNPVSCDNKTFNRALKYIQLTKFVVRFAKSLRECWWRLACSTAVVIQCISGRLPTQSTKELMISRMNCSNKVYK